MSKSNAANSKTNLDGWTTPRGKLLASQEPLIDSIAVYDNIYNSTYLDGERYELLGFSAKIKIIGFDPSLIGYPRTHAEQPEEVVWDEQIYVAQLKLTLDAVNGSGQNYPLIAFFECKWDEDKGLASEFVFLDVKHQIEAFIPKVLIEVVTLEDDNQSKFMKWELVSADGSRDMSRHIIGFAKKRSDFGTPAKRTIYETTFLNTFLNIERKGEEATGDHHSTPARATTLQASRPPQTPASTSTNTSSNPRIESIIKADRRWRNQKLWYRVKYFGDQNISPYIPIEDLVDYRAMIDNYHQANNRVEGPSEEEWEVARDMSAKKANKKPRTRRESISDDD